MLKIVTAPNPVLNTICTPYSEEDLGSKHLKKFAKQLEKTMYKFDGVGLAAPQVGVTRRIIVVDCTEQSEKHPLILVNPEIVEASNKLETLREGCLSLPGIQVDIERHESVVVSFYDVDGNHLQVSASDLLARCLQHEIDHLNGKTMFESCSVLARVQALQDYEIAKQNGAKPGQVD